MVDVTAKQIAFLTPEIPWPPDQGGKLRTFYLLKAVGSPRRCRSLCPRDGSRCAHANHGNSLPFDTPDRSGCADPLAGTNQELVEASPAFRAVLARRESWAKLQRLLVRRRYDLLVCDEIGMAPYLPAQSDSARLIMRQKIDFLHYREMAQSRSLGVAKALDWLEARRLQRYERQQMPTFDAAVVCSQDDGVIAQQEGAPAVHVIENGADFDYFTPQRRPDSRPTILMLGTMHYFPNIDLVNHFFENMYAPLVERFPDLQVLLVGHNPPESIRRLASRPGVTVTGSVPDVRPYMAQSWLLAVPLRLGGGTRLKIVEAMAAELPVVSTRIGAQGLAFQDGEHLLLADSAGDFVEAVSLLLRDEMQRRRLAEAALTFARDRYSWNALGARFAELCVGLGGGSPL
ncbi:MAG: glycosyltransferase [Caldilineaceae bacterium]|nr:glycosyltransferase [Caldilineaceae bacterium]